MEFNFQNVTINNEHSSKTNKQSKNDLAKGGFWKNSLRDTPVPDPALVQSPPPLGPAVKYEEDSSWRINPCMAVTRAKASQSWTH